jgi:hypothetical protein
LGKLAIKSDQRHHAAVHAARRLGRLSLGLFRHLESVT